MIDKKIIGKEFPPLTVDVEKGRLRFFAKAIGETNPVYSDEAAAKAAGHPSLLMPPTFLFCLEMEQPDPYAWFEGTGIELPRILHGEQSFTYHRAAYAGDTLTFASRIVDLYDKKKGALEFVVRETRVTNQKGEHIADIRNTIVQRNG